MYLSSSFSGIVFCQQGPTLWAIDELVQVLAINLKESDVIAAMHNKERKGSCRRLQDHRPFVIRPTDGEDFSSHWLGAR